MAILRFQQSDESSEPAVLEIHPQSSRELLVIHRHPRPASVRVSLQLTPIGLQVLYKLVELLRGWPQSLPKSLNSCSITQQKKNGDFLERLIIDVKRITVDFTTKSIDEATSEGLHLPDRLVHALLLMNVAKQRDHCFICGLPLEEDRRAALLPTAVELGYNNCSSGYWTLMGISINRGFADGVFKLCPDHEWSMNRVFGDLMISDRYKANPDWRDY